MSGRSERSSEHLAVWQRLLTCPTPQSPPMPITIAACSCVKAHSSWIQSFSSRNAKRQASPSQIPETTVVSRSSVRMRVAPIDAGRFTGLAEATIRVPTSGAATTSPSAIAALQSPKYSQAPSTDTGRMIVAPAVIHGNRHCPGNRCPRIC